MQGVNAQTGAAIEGVEHLQQSIVDILLTPLGSRVMRRDYGSELFELVDRPMTDELRVDAIAASVEAINRWEPRLELISKISVTRNTDGRFELDIYGKLVTGEAVTLSGITV